MYKKELSLQDCIEQYTIFTDRINKYIPEKRAKQLLDFFNTREVTLTTSPYSIKSDLIGCYAGGFIVTINKLIEAVLILDKVWDKFDKEKQYTTEELLFSAIMCEIGKLGSNEEPFFIQNDIDWEVKNRGLLYKYNPIYTNMKYSDKALYILQQENIKVSENEFLAIKLYNSVLDEDNNFYLRRDTKPKSNIAIILNQAYMIATNTK